MIKSLFVLYFGANEGYAISSLEKLFFDTGLILAENDVSGVHFSFPDTKRNLSNAFPEGFVNVLQFDINNVDQQSLEILTAYVRKHEIQLVVLLDIQPIHPSYRVLRDAGVTTIISYWGAPISSVAPLWKRTIKKAQIMLSRSKVDGLIFESESMAHMGTHGRGAPRKMIDVVPLGVNIQKFKPGDTTYVYNACGFEKQRKIFVYSGHMEERKGVRVIVEAAMELFTKRNRKDVGFLICGNKGTESESYEKMYSGLGLDDHIQFGGYRDDLPQIYESAYGGIIASTGWDSYTYASLEMAASGLPVIASRLQGLAEAVVDKKTGILFEPGNANQLADCIEYLVDNPEVADEYGRQGRLRCENSLSYQHQVERLVQAIKKRWVDNRWCANGSY